MNERETKSPISSVFSLSVRIVISMNREIELESSERDITRFINFEQLFQRCFDEFQGSNIYVCIENTGAKFYVTLATHLVLIKDENHKNNNIRNNVSLSSAGIFEFSINTFTEYMEAKVNHFQLEDC